ncbi:hypothetical protein CH330_04705 [candidate division WOR-3 bacterium JGI_Cruoil_03_51_56]|uniref:Uncharacterized protein n=1 Tax=candidate division WOR-3 bacterium JGI_Cruoil_03_51_56 TaxID=1973747 RepID=A0A235BUR0_UNCW3|nr:MAG: hypothetical protein CH330_04705 [candidate division WOR-3 bacterium JGI_Cruoil_03_51_56]
MKGVVILPLLLGVLYAGPVQFSGSVSIYGEKSFVSGDDSLIAPVSDLTFSLNPSVSFWGFPLSLDLLFSSQENNLRQQLNKYRIFLHPKELLGQMVNLPGFMFSIHGIEIGTCQPSYSSFTLSGTPVTGGAVELNPWKVYLAGTVGRTQRAVDASDSTDAAYSRMLYAGKFGYGKKEATHFYFTGLYAKDDPNSLEYNQMPMPGDTEPPIDSFEVVTPEENYLLGMELNLFLVDGLLTLESEVSAIELNRDTRMPVLDADWVRRWGLGFLHPRWCSQFDFAYAVRPALNVLDTRIYGEVQMVGPGYQSLGAPSLRNDNLAYGGGIKRDFLDNQVSASASYTREQDNLIGMKLSTTYFTSYAVDLGLNFTSLPYLQISYSPYSEYSDSTNSKADVISAGMGYSFNIGTLSHSPSLSGSYQKYQAASSEGNYTSFDFGLSYSVGFEFPLSVSASSGFGQTVYSEETDRTVYFDVSPSYTLFESWTNSLTLGGSFGGGTRYDVRLNLSFPVWRVCNASFGLEECIYSGSDGKYNEFRLTGNLSKNW